MIGFRRFAGLFLLLAPWAASAAEVVIDGSDQHRGARTGFATYGFNPSRCVALDREGFRFRLPGGVAGVGQTGVYSLFVLAGDCEVVLTYEVITLQRPTKGYGSGVGVALDAGDEVGRAAIQRVGRTTEGGGYALHGRLVGAKQKPQDDDRFVQSRAKRGRMGIRRIKNELVFLASDDPAGSLEEIGRMTFTDKTIRAVRLFADPGGSPTALDVRVTHIKVTAEEITGAVPARERKASKWWLLAIPVAVACGLLVWRIRVRRRAGSADG